MLLCEYIWKCLLFFGIEIFGKIVGVVGLGCIG